LLSSCNLAPKCFPLPSRYWLCWPPLVNPFPYYKQVYVFVWIILCISIVFWPYFFLDAWNPRR
jgi:hypothetical protein